MPNRVSRALYHFRVKDCVLQEESGIDAGSPCRANCKSVNFIGQVEGTGTIRGVSLETLFKIAQVLKIPPSKLLEDD